jgi:hypothetical protein
MKNELYKALLDTQTLPDVSQKETYVS